MNLIGPSLVRDLLDLLIALEGDEGIHVVVFASADEEFFIPHVDLTRVAEYSKKPRVPAASRTARWAASSGSSATHDESQSLRSRDSPAAWEANLPRVRHAIRISRTRDLRSGRSRFRRIARRCDFDARSFAVRANRVTDLQGSIVLTAGVAATRAAIVTAPYRSVRKIEDPRKFLQRQLDVRLSEDSSMLYEPGETSSFG
jgi:hypothetical protein